MMEDAPNPEMPRDKPKRPREPLKKPQDQSPIPLDYGQSRYPDATPKPSTLAQAFAGFFFWIAAAAVAVGFLISTNSNAITDWVGRLSIGLELAVIVGLAAWVRIKLQWQGFIPGILLGFGLTCLVPIGIITVICGHL